MAYALALHEVYYYKKTEFSRTCAGRPASEYDVFRYDEYCVVALEIQHARRFVQP
jgi:hypothetical protein